MYDAIRELVSSAQRWRLWTAFAWEDVRTTYRRSLIGVLWISLSFTIFVAVKILIFSMFMNRVENDYYSAYLVLGFFSWQFMAQIVNAGPNVFTSNEHWLRNDPIELPLFVFQKVTRSLFDLALTGAVVIAALFIFGLGASLWSLLAIPALLLYLLNAIWVILLLGVICTRYRDVAHLISTAMRVMFFLTPIIWLPQQLTEQVSEILWWNPFAHFMWILRTPILDQAPAIESWVFVLVLTVVGWISALSAFAMSRKRIMFWF